MCLLDRKLQPPLSFAAIPGKSDMNIAIHLSGHLQPCVAVEAIPLPLAPEAFREPAWTAK